MNKLFTKIGVAFVGMAMAIGVGVAVGGRAQARVAKADSPVEVLSFSRSGSTDSYTSGYTFSTAASAQTGYYQDGSGTLRHLTLYHTSTKLWANTPASISFTAKLGGGTAKNPLTNSVYVALTDKTGAVIEGTETVVTTKITTTTGSDFDASIPTANSTNAYGVKLYHTKETGYNVRYYSFSLSYVANTTPTVTFDNSAVSLKTNNSTGVTKSVETSFVTNVAYTWSTDDTNIQLENTNTSTVTIKPNTNVAGSATVSLLVTGGNISNYVDSFTVNISLPASYTITVTANNCTYTGASTILEDDEATINFTPSDGYVLPAAPNSISGATVKSFIGGELVLQNPTANVTLTVTAVSYKNDVAHIVSGGQYKIYHTVDDVKYYVSATPSSTQQPVITTDSWKATIFTFTLVGDNTISITSGGYYLYNTNTNNGVRLHTNSGTNWVLSAGTHYDSESDSAIADSSGYYNVLGTSSRYLSLYMGQQSDTPTDFRCYQFNYKDNTCNKARLSSTQFEYYDATAYAQDVVKATKAVCDLGYNNSKSSFTTKDASDNSIWDYLTTDYGFLASNDKALLVGATYTRNDSDVEATGTTTQAIAEGVARHDYLVSKYALDNILTGRVVPSLSRIDLGFASNIVSGDSTTLLIVIISSMSLISACGFFMLKKKKEQ